MDSWSLGMDGLIGVAKEGGIGGAEGKDGRDEALAEAG